MPPSELSEQQWLVVHEVRLRGVMVIADQAALEPLVALGLVVVRGERVALTDAGRACHVEWARTEGGTPAHTAAQLLYDSFHDLNRELLEVCTAWQVLPSGARNEHRDLRYDWTVIERLERLHERAVPRVRRTARDIVRFRGYEPRLRHALRMVVDEGAPDWLTGTRVDSYHIVWNQLHEDLLLALGRDRSEEPPV
jgi:hypothetical protein